MLDEIFRGKGPANGPETILQKYDLLREHEEGLEHIAEKNSLVTPTMRGRTCRLHVRKLLLNFAITDNVS